MRALATVCAFLAFALIFGCALVAGEKRRRPARAHARPLDLDAMLWAIRQVETGDNPRALGRLGERSAYQFRALTWRNYVRAPFRLATTNPHAADLVAARHLRSSSPGCETASCRSPRSSWRRPGSTAPSSRPCMRAATTPGGRRISITTVRAELFQPKHRTNMKPLAELDAPPAPTPELLPHDWAPNGECLNPEKVAVDFGAKRGKREAVLFLGLRADGTWRAGWALALKNGERHTQPLIAAEPTFNDRGAAMRFALSAATQRFEGDAPAVRTISAMFGQSFGAKEAAAGESLPANTSGTATSAPLPPSVPLELPLAAIQPNPENPRSEHPLLAEQELADSIASTGLIQRIAVRKLLPHELGEFPEFAGQDRYEIIAGERRWRAFQRLKRETIPADVFEGLTRAQVKAAALVENGQRLGLNPVDEAVGFRELMGAEGLTQEQCAQRVGVSRPVVTNALRMLDLPPEVLRPVRERKLTVAHAVALARFKAWPSAVRIMAETAVANGMSAASLEKGIPCLTELVRAGAVVQCHIHDVDHEWPSQIKKHPAYEKLNEWTQICFEPEHWRGIVDAHEEDRREAAAAEAERQRKAAEKAAKNPAKIKSLADLPPSSYVSVEGQDELALKLTPSETMTEVKGDGDGRKVAICTKPDLFKRIEAEVAALKRADRAAKWPGVIRDALAAIYRVKKLGLRELTLLLYLAGTHEVLSRPCFGEESAKAMEVKLPKKAFDPDYDGQIALSSHALAQLADVEPVKLFRVLVDNWVREIEDQLLAVQLNVGVDSDAGIVLRWLLERDDLGFLEETKAGQKQLVEAVKAAPWYQEALAAIEGGEKPAKKGGK